jgi:hypothetical protein
MAGQVAPEESRRHVTMTKSHRQSTESNGVPSQLVEPFFSVDVEQRENVV